MYCLEFFRHSNRNRGGRSSRVRLIAGGSQGSDWVREAVAVCSSRALTHRYSSKQTAGSIDQTQSATFTSIFLFSISVSAWCVISTETHCWGHWLPRSPLQTEPVFLSVRGLYGQRTEASLCWPSPFRPTRTQTRLFKNFSSPSLTF